MERKLNLIGIKQLKLVEAKETLKVSPYNIDWLNQQLVNAGYKLKNTANELDIICDRPIISLFASYTNNNEKLINDVKLQRLIDFPNTKASIDLKGKDLDGDGMKDAILQMIPSNKTLVEEDIVIPSQSMDNMVQFEQSMNYVRNTFSVKIDNSMKDDSAVNYILTLKNKYPLFKMRVDNNVFSMKVFNQSGQFKQYNSFEDMLHIVEKNLGIDDLTSNIYKDKQQEYTIANQDYNEEESEEQETQEKETTFTPRGDLRREAANLRAKLSQPVQAILQRANEDYDRKNIGVWDTALKKCRDESDKDILIQLFLNKKMNISTNQVQKNFIGLREWANKRGFDIDKNLALRFIDNYDDKFPKQEIPEGSAILLSDLANRKIISEDTGSANILNDKDSILYNPNIYKNLNNTYGDVIDTVSIYNRLYNMTPINDKQKIENINSAYSELTPEIIKQSSQLAKKVCLNGSKLRDIDEVESMYSMISDKAYKRERDETADLDINELIKDFKQDKAIDNLDKASPRTLKLVQKAANDTFKQNIAAANDFLTNLAKGAQS